MDIQDQKFMARDGVITWATGVVDTAARLSKWNEGIADALRDPATFPDARRAFQRDRHFFLNAAKMLFEYRDWYVRVEPASEGAFDEIDHYRQHVISLRNMNEHVVEYFTGSGRTLNDWWHESSETGRSDASATCETKIGGRLDWVDLSDASKRLIPKMPA